MEIMDTLGCEELQKEFDLEDTNYVWFDISRTTEFFVLIILDLYKSFNVL